MRTNYQQIFSGNQIIKVPVATRIIYKWSISICKTKKEMPRFHHAESGPHDIRKHEAVWERFSFSAEVTTAVNVWCESTFVFHQIIRKISGKPSVYIAYQFSPKISYVLSYMSHRR